MDMINLLLVKIEIPKFKSEKILKYKYFVNLIGYFELI